MKSFTLVFAGAIAGICATLLFHNTKTADNIPVEDEAVLTAAKSEPPSPFAPVATTVEQKPTSSISNNDNEIDFNNATAPQATAIANSKHYRQLLTTLHYIRNADSNDLINLLEALPTANNNPPFFTEALHASIYHRWAEIDIDDALTYAADQANSTGDRYTRNPALAISILAALEPTYVQEWINNNASQSNSLRYAAYTGIATSDPETFLRNLLATADSLDSDRNTDQGELFGAIHTAISRWGEIDPQAAMAFLNAEGARLDATGLLPQDEGMKEYLLYRWYEQDPDAALVEIEALMNDPTLSANSRMQVTDLYARHLATRDPDTALQWALTQENPMLRENALMNIIHSWDIDDNTGLISFIDQLPSDQRESLLPMAAPQIASSMARTDPQSAIAWAEQLPIESKQYALSNIVHQWIETDPSSAANWIQSLPATPENQSLLMDAAGSLIYTDPSLATEVFSQLPETVQTSYVEHMVFMRAEQNPDSAREWISQQSSPTVRELGLITLDSMDPGVDAVSLLDRVASLEVGDREGLLMNFIGPRAGYDIEPIKQWLAATPLLTESERAMLTDITNSFPSGYNGGYFPQPTYER